MTHFFEKRSARPPMARRPAMLVARIVMEATRHVEFSSASPSLVWSVKPWSRKTNFMWKFTAPMAPMAILGGIGAFLQRLLFKLAAVPVSMFALFLVYWLLPNRKIEPARVAPVAIVVGLILEGLKYVNMLLANVVHEKLDREYKIFEYSVTILLWSFASALVVLAGAHWTARRDTADPLS